MCPSCPRGTQDAGLGLGGRGGGHVPALCLLLYFISSCLASLKLPGARILGFFPWLWGDFRFPPAGTAGAGAEGKIPYSVLHVHRL